MFAFFTQRIYCHLLVAYALGILVGYHWPAPVELLVRDVWLIAILLGALGALWWLVQELKSSWAHTPGYAILAILGLLSASIAIGLPNSAPLRQYADADSVVMIGHIASVPKYQRGHLRFMLQVSAIKTTVEQPTAGSCYVFVKAETPPPAYYTDRVRIYGTLSEAARARNHGQFDYRAYLLNRGTVLTAYAPSAACLTRLDTAEPFPWAQLAHLRERLTGTLAQGMPAGLAELAISVVYGDKITDLDPQIEERFRRAGLTHILVASGTQVSLLIMLMALLFWRAPHDFSWRGVLLAAGQFFLTLTVVLSYAAVTGFETSIVRALGMGILIMLGRLLHRQADGLTMLAQSALILLLANPLDLFAAGFQLSFAATFGLIYVWGVGYPLISHLTGWRLHFAQMLLTTGGAQLFVAPILAAGFQQLSLWGLLSNLLAIPLAFALLIVGGLVSLGLGVVPLVGDLSRLLTLSLSWLLDNVARVFAVLPGSDLAVPEPPWWWLVAFYVFVLSAGEWLKLQRQPKTPRRQWLKLLIPIPALVVYSGVLIWWLVPQPELAMLSLPGGEAYIWRPYTGRSVLLLRGAGLSRQHNADTVASAIRWRGINKIHSTIWLDEPKPTALAINTGEPTHLIGNGLPGNWDIDWLDDDGQHCGARCALGANELWMVWDAAAFKDCASNLTKRQAYAVFLSLATWKNLGPDEQAILKSKVKRICVVDARHNSNALDDILRSTTELRAQLHGNVINIQAFTPKL